MSAPRWYNSAIVRAPERLLRRGAPWASVAVGVRYGRLETADGPVLIDTGYGPRATEGRKRSFMLKVYGAVLRPQLVRNELPAAVLGRLGYLPGDVRRIVVTHFHPDHIAALRDFPNARFIASGEAWTAIGRMSAHAQIRNGIFTELLPEDFGARLLPIEDLPVVEAPLGLGPGRDLWGDGTCLAVPLPGHAIGHFGLVWPKRERPLLYAADVTWLGAALVEDQLPTGPAQLIYADGRAMAESAAGVRRFAEAGGEVVLCHERVAA